MHTAWSEPIPTASRPCALSWVFTIGSAQTHVPFPAHMSGPHCHNIQDKQKDQLSLPCSPARLHQAPTQLVQMDKLPLSITSNRQIATPSMRSRDRCQLSMHIIHPAQHRRPCEQIQLPITPSNKTVRCNMPSTKAKACALSRQTQHPSLHSRKARKHSMDSMERNR